MRGRDGISGTNYWSINSAILSLFVRGEFPSWAIRVYDNTAWYFTGVGECRYTQQCANEHSAPIQRGSCSVISFCETHFAHQPWFAIEREEMREMKRRCGGGSGNACGAEKRSASHYFLGGRGRREVMEDECTWRYIRYTVGHFWISSFLRSYNFCSLIHLSNEHRKVARGAAPRRHPPSRSLGTSRFTANLFRGVNHATLIFTQLCSPAYKAPRPFQLPPQLVRGVVLKPSPFCRRSHPCSDRELSRLFP